MRSLGLGGCGELVAITAVYKAKTQVRDQTLSYACHGVDMDIGYPIS